MNKKELIIPFILVGLGLAFTVISFAVFLTNGKSKKWVARKMKIGGLLLTFSLFSCSENRNYVVSSMTCYMVISDIPSAFEIEIDSNRIIYGNMSRRYGDFSYSLVDNQGIIVQKSKLFPKRYMSDPENQDFLIEVDQKLKKGKYNLKLYNCELKEQDSTESIHEHEIQL